MTLRFRRPRLTYANVMATVAIFLSLGGTAYAAVVITGKNVKNGTLEGLDVRNGSLTGADIRNGSIDSTKLSAKARSQLKGTPGDAGRAGSDGISGAPGAKGSDGRSGADGSSGNDGQAGSDGAPGIVGELDDLQGIPCVRASAAGTVSMTFTATGDASFFCELLMEPDALEENDASTSASPVTFQGAGRTVHASVDANVAPRGDDDWYTFTVTNYGSNGGNLAIDLDAESDRSSMTVYRNGNPVVRDNQGIFGRNQEQYPATTVNVWTIKVAAPVRESYELEVSIDRGSEYGGGYPEVVLS